MVLYLLSFGFKQSWVIFFEIQHWDLWLKFIKMKQLRARSGNGKSNLLRAYTLASSWVQQTTQSWEEGTIRLLFQTQIPLILAPAWDTIICLSSLQDLLADCQQIKEFFFAGPKIMMPSRVFPFLWKPLGTGFISNGRLWSMVTCSREKMLNF